MRKKPFMCKKCRRRFVQLRWYYRHTKEKHPELLEKEWQII
jgi:hypothetical protein